MLVTSQKVTTSKGLPFFFFRIQIPDSNIQTTHSNYTKEESPSTSILSPPSLKVVYVIADNRS